MKWGYHAVYAESFEDAIDAGRKYHFDYVQFDLNVPRFYIDRLPQPRLADIRSRSRDLGVGITFHAPGDYVGLTMDIEPIRRGMLEHIGRIIEVAEFLDSHHVTFHPLAPPAFRRSDTRASDFETEYADYYREVFETNVRTIDSMTRSVRIAIENHKIGPSVRNALESILDEENSIGLCLDIPKLHVGSSELDTSLLAMYRSRISKIIEVHAHDAVPGASHLEPGTGDIDFEPFLPFMSLPDIHVTLEVRPVEAAARSRDYLLGLAWQSS